MIEPYRTAIEKNVEKLNAINFNLASDSDYMTLFIGNEHALRISTEKFYHPTILMVLVNKQGKEFELGLLEKIIDPTRHEENIKCFKSFSEKHELSLTPNVLEKKPDEVTQYASMFIERMLDFLIAWKPRIFFDAVSYEVEYRKQEKTLLGNFGVQ